MIELTIIEKAVLELIPRGIERKIAISELVSLVGIDERSMYTIINNLRKKGVPICAKRSGENRGYYVATNEEEKERGLASYKSQVKDMRELINAIEKADISNWMENIKGADEAV